MSNNDNRSPFRSRPLHNPNPNNQHPFSPFAHSINGGHQPLLNQQQLGFQDLTPSQTIMSFRDLFHRSVDYNSVSEAFEMSFFPSEVMEDHHHRHHGNPRVSTQQQQQIVSSPVNYSISSSSEGDRDRKIMSKEVLKQNGQDHMGSAEDLGKSKKRTKSKMKEKAVKEAKFAFLTKSEVDHLEDGYRWRKYGQKAVKNSSYPRCTSPKCPVKKQIERSQHDPTIVITTYEGQHNHRYPANIRGCARTADPFFGTSFGSVMARQDIFPRPQLLLSQTLVSQKPAFQEHGIMQDIDPFRVRKSELG